MKEQPKGDGEAGRHPSERLIAIGVPLAAGLVGAGVWMWFGVRTRIGLEDAYITFRYARNVAEGVGFVYNAGERVLGTTTPLQTVLLAGLGVVFGPEHIPAIASVVMPIFGLAAGLVAYAALVRLGLPRAGAAAGCLAFYVHPKVIRTSLGGMETPLAIFLMALSLYFLAKRRSVAATIVVGALALCRVDGLIWGGLVVGGAMLSSYRKVWQQAVAFAAAVAPWGIFAFAYFGSPLPNSMMAKAVVRPGTERLLTEPLHFRRMYEWYVSGTGFDMEQPMFRVWLVLMGVGIYALVRAKRRELLLVPAFPLVYAVVMYVGRAARFEWYLVPMLFCCLLLGGLGIGEVVSWAASARANWKLRVVAAGCVGAMIPGVQGFARDFPKQVSHTKRYQENERGLRRRVGLWLRDKTPEGASVAMEAIGYQGYYSERRVIDMAGLVSPRVVEFKASTGSNAVVFRRITRELKPDYIVLRSFEVDENRHFNGGRLFETEGDREVFFGNYREAGRYSAPHPELGPRVWHLTVYERKGSAGV